MDSRKKEKESEEKAENAKLIENRQAEFGKVILETPSLLNMIKHCQDQKINTASSSESKFVTGNLVGYMKKDLDGINIYVSQTVPDVKSTTKSLKAQIEAQQAESKKDSEATNSIGFYTSCELGLVFNTRNLVTMIVQYRNFRNSVMVAYDVDKSQYGLCPFACYRLSEEAIAALNLDDPANITDQLVQDNIQKHKLKIDEFFEEIPMKIHRSHLLQAFLFDHIQPKMPAFNPQVFNIAKNGNALTHHLYRASEQSQVLLEELGKVEQQHKKMIQQAKKKNKEVQKTITANRDKTVKGSTADIMDRAALESFKVEDNSNNKLDLFMFSMQCDQLANQIGEFEECFTDQYDFSKPAAGAEEQ